MTFYELMTQSLSALLEPEEVLQYPVYGTLMQGKAHWFGYFGLTDNDLLSVLLQGDSKKVYGFPTQEENLNGFLDALSNRPNHS